ncbi:hypothetical protein B0H67DRAFT_652118 [Lasiosphaeris hirsuta]|uniref:Uncharacterized protein n=1 Tax=Lasiosphaeris hirsuta TaxID=260670 RepID=A0AA40B9V9_9PEZI|nr:hypothetical protein B0H67DRAFT_652118 [Lasiosphaeris hirsuta]
MCDHTMDPSGDVIFTLRNPNAPLAIWDDETPPDQPTKPTESTPPASPIVEPPKGADTVPLQQQDNEDASQEGPPVTFLLSSRHLSLASPIFEAMLTAGWSESEKTDGHIAMNVLHSHYNQVPKTVTLKTLAKIAVIVDYYDMHEAFQPIAQQWIEALRSKSLPTSLGHDVTLWILVSWVFGDAVIFRYVTKVAILRSQRDMEVADGLPIPRAIINRINEYRDDAMGSIAAGFSRLGDQLTEGSEGCGPECRAMHLGALILNFHRLKFSVKQPEWPFGSISLAQVVEGLSGIKSPIWHVCYETLQGYGPHQCPATLSAPANASGAFVLGVGEKITANPDLFGLLEVYSALLVSEAKDKMQGLELADFVSPRPRQARKCAARSA